MAPIKPSRQKGDNKRRQKSNPKNEREAENDEELKNSIKVLGGNIEEDYGLVRDVESDGLEEEKNAVIDVSCHIFYTSTAFFYLP